MLEKKLDFSLMYILILPFRIWSSSSKTLVWLYEKFISSSTNPLFLKGSMNFQGPNWPNGFSGQFLFGYRTMIFLADLPTSMSPFQTDWLMWVCSIRSAITIELTLNDFLLRERKWLFGQVLTMRAKD